MIVAKEIKRRHKIGQPLLVGTISIEKSEKLSRLLKREGVKHQVLNAKHHEREARIIARAGEKGMVTIATNMAGGGGGCFFFYGGPETVRLIEKSLRLRSIDNLWIEHLTSIEGLREGIGLRGYGQRDPLMEYKREAYGM